MFKKRAQKVNTVAQETDYRKIESREFWQISGWVFSLFYKNEPFYTTASLALTTVTNLNDIINTLIIGKMVDKLISIAGKTGASMTDLYPYIGVLIGYNIFNHILHFLSRYADIGLEWLMRPKINRALQERMRYLGIQTLEKPDINDKIQRAEDSTQNLSAYMGELVEVISDSFKIILSLVIIGKFFPLFIPLIFVLSIPYFVFDRKFRTKNYQFIYDKTPDLRRAGMSSQDLRNATKLNELSIIGGYNFLNDKYYKFHYWYEQQRVNMFKTWRASNAITRIINDVAVYFGYIKVFKDILNQIITIGDGTFRISVISRLSITYQMAVKTYNNIMETSVRVRDIYFLFHTKPAFADGSIQLPKMDKGPELDIKDLTFSYPNSEKLIFNNLSLKFKSGEKVAIVGHNGAGKTTLVKLLCRIYLPTSGDILINGINLRDISIESWYRNIGVLFQEYNTYPQLTAKENIIIGRPNEPVDEMDLHLATQSADATQFIEDFSNKYDQILSEKFKGGTRPSTGQWQKLAIARFFYRNAPLVIFDEPTASIDAVSEYNIFNKIYEFFNDKTVLIISHRFSTVRNADRIIVLDHGEIVEDGNHDELMSKNSYYAKAFMLQAKGYTNSSSETNYYLLLMLLKIYTYISKLSNCMNKNDTDIFKNRGESVSQHTDNKPWLIFIAIFVLLLPVALNIKYWHNDEWVYYPNVQRLREGNFTLHPLTAPTFYSTGLLAVGFSYIFGVDRIPILTLLVTVISAYLLFITLHSKEKVPKFHALLLSLIYLANPLLMFTTWGFMTDNYYVFYMLVSVYFLAHPHTTVSNSKSGLLCFILGNVFAILAYFTRQLGLSLPLAFGIWYLMKKSRRFATIELLLFVLLSLFHFIVFPRSTESLETNFIFSNLTHFQYIFSLCFVILIYLSTFLLPLFVCLVVNFIKTRKHNISFLLFIIGAVVISLLYFKNIGWINDRFFYLKYTVQRDGFFTENLHGTKQDFVYSGALYFLVDIVAKVVGISLVGLMMFNRRFKTLLNPYFLILVLHIALLLITEKVYDRYLIPLFPLFILSISSLFTHNFLSRRLFQVFGMFYLAILIFVSYNFSADYILTNNYVWNKSVQLVYHYNIPATSIVSTDAWRYLYPTSQIVYKFTYDNQEKQDYSTNWKLVDVRCVGYPLKIFNNCVYLYNKLNRDTQIM